MTLSTPGGRPASRRHSAISRCVPGQISEAFSTTVLPQASGSAMARTPRMTGAFHGAMLSTTPAGWRTAIAMQPGLSEGMTSPEICVVMAAASRSMPAARWTLKPAQPAVAPVSAAISSMNCGAFDARRSAAFSRMARRAFGPVADQAGKAAAAVSAARFASAIWAAAARLAMSPVTGLRRSKVAPFEAGTSLLSSSSEISCMAFSPQAWRYDDGAAAGRGPPR